MDDIKYSLDINTLIQWLVPLVVSYIMDWSAKIQAFISGWKPLAKQVFYVALVVLAAVIVWYGKGFFGMTRSDNMIVAVVQGVVMGVIATLIYRRYQGGTIRV